MVKVYYDLILQRVITLEDVPDVNGWRDDVKRMLIANGFMTEAEAGTNTKKTNTPNDGMIAHRA